MTKEAALYSFWSAFDLPAYEENSVYSLEPAAVYPYLTYEVQTGGYGVVIPLTANLYYRSSSWLNANAKKTEIANRIENGGIRIPCDGGYIRIFKDKNTSFAKNLGDDSDDMVKRVLMTIYVEFMTEN